MPEPRHLAPAREGPGRAARAGLAGIAAGAAVLVVSLTLAGTIGAGPGPAAPAAVPVVSRSSAEAAPGDRASAATASRMQDPRPLPLDIPTSGVVPERLRIPDIGVDSALAQLSIGDGGVLRPPDDLSTAGWYPGSAVPGAVGPAVLAGHVDDTRNVGVFARLRELRPGAAISVVLSDRTERQFRMVRSIDVAKSAFPTEEVYGPTPNSQLRLITCNGPYDFEAMHYRNNLVVFAVPAP